MIWAIRVPTFDNESEFPQLLFSYFTRTPSPFLPTMPTRAKKLRWTTDNQADLLLKKLFSGEELVDGVIITGNEAPSEIYFLFEEFQKYDQSVFRAHWSKIKREMKGSQAGELILTLLCHIPCPLSNI